jgi:DNA-binding CsgD family transcriptional regulator
MDPDRILEQIAEIYAAVGDAKRWRAFEALLASGCDVPQEVRHHIEPARRAHQRMVDLAAHHDVLRGVYERIVPAALVVDRERRLHDANAAARRLLEAESGLAVVDGRVRLAAMDEDEALSLTVARAAAENDGTRELGNSLVSVSRRGQRPLSLLVLGCRHRAPMFFDSPRVLLLVFDADGPSQPNATLLGRLFNLTPREAGLAALLMQGQSIDDAARSLGIALNTARTLLKRVSAKTDTHSQAELLRLLLTAPLPSGDPA